MQLCLSDWKFNQKVKFFLYRLITHRIFIQKKISTEKYVQYQYLAMTSLVLWVMEVISLWHCWDVKKTQIALILGFNFFALLVLVFHLRLDNTLEIVGDVQNRSVYWSKSSTEMPLSLEELLIFLAVWADVESCWNFKLTNVKTFLVGDYSNIQLLPRPADLHGSPNYHCLCELHLGPQGT